MSGPDLARDSALASPIPTSGQLSCFVETSLLVPQVPEGYVVPSRFMLPSVPALPSFSASGSSSDSDMLSQMRLMMEQLISQKLTEQTQTLTQSFQSSIANMCSDLEKEQTERLEGRRVYKRRWQHLNM